MNISVYKGFYITPYTVTVFYRAMLEQCGNFMIFPSLIFYVKSTLEILEVQNLPFQNIQSLFKG